MLNPTDYAAYSRATGTPYPESPEERAQMAPEVRAFRQNQLQRSNNQGSETLALGIGLGLGLAGLGAGALKLRARGKAQPKKDTAGKSSVKMVDLSDQQVPKSKTQVYADVAAKPEGDFTEYSYPRGELTEKDVYPRMQISEEGYLDYPEVSKQTEATRRFLRSKERSIINQNRKGVDQGEIPGIQGDLTETMLAYLRSKQISPFATQKDLSQLGIVQSAPSRSLSIAPNQLSLLDYGQDVERLNSLLKNLEPDVERESRAMMGQESARQTRNVNEVKKIKAEEILREIQQEDTLVDFQKNREPLIEEQSAAALNTAEDQSDGRFLRELQRNEDIDMTMVNEDVIDAASTQSAQDALFRENQLVQDARDYLIRQEIDLKYDYTPEESRQAAAVGQALERIQNNPTRVAAEGIIDELRTEARAVADRARFAKEQRQGKTGELFGYREADNIRQRKEQKTLSAIDAPRETIESVLTGEDAPIETNLQSGKLRGGLIDEAGDIRFFGAGSEITDASTGARVGKQGEQYKKKAQLDAMFSRYSDDELEQIASNKARIPYGDMMQQDLDELRTAQRLLKTRAQTSMDKGVDMSGPQYRALNRGRKGLEASEASRKRFENQRPVPASQPVQDVARSLETLRQGMSVEPSEAAPVTPDIRNIGIGFEGDKEIIGAIGPSDAYTGAARDAAGSLKNVVVGESAPLVQGGVVSNPEVAAQIEDQSQAFLQRAISGGLTQKANPGVEVYETPRMVGPAELSGPGSVPLSRTAAPDPQRGPEPSQRLGYARYYVGPEGTGSKPAGVVTGVSPTVNIDYASMPQSDVYRPSDVGRIVPNLSASQGSVKPVPGYLQSLPKVSSRQPLAGPAQVNYRPPAPGYTDIGDRPAPTEAAPIGPLTQSLGLPKIGRVDRGPALENQATGPVITQYGQNIRYPNMRGQERFTTEQLMNDPALRGGPVKMPNRFRDQFVIERPRGY